MAEIKEDIKATEPKTEESQEPKAAETPQAEPEQSKAPTVEELQAQIAALTEANEKQKQAISNANADAADWKRKYRAGLDEIAREKEEQAEALAKKDARLSELEAKERMNTYASMLMHAGYDPTSAQAMASQLPEGVPDSFFEAQKAFLEQTKQTIKTQTLNSQPNLSQGMPPATPPDENTQLRRWFGLT